MRIGIDATSWTNQRGYGRFTRELLHAIASLPSDDEYVMLADRQTAEQAQFPTGWSTIVAATSMSQAEAAASDARRSIRDMWAMRRMAGIEPLDLVFFPTVYSYFPLGGDVPCVVTFHDVIPETHPNLVFENRRSQFLWNVKTRLALRRSSSVVTVSEASKKGLMKVFGIPADRIRLISEAPSAEFRPVRDAGREHQEVLERYNMHVGEAFFLYVGGISPHKNIDALIRAVADMRTEPVCSPRLVLVGDYEKDVFRTCHADLSQLSQSLGIADRVSFVGFVPDEDLAHLYSASLAFVLPSFLEGFGLPAVEAMACGAAVIASDRGSLPEVVGGAGHLFDPSDLEALIHALRLLATDETYREELRAQSLDRARDFQWERSARRAVEIFHEYAP
jgi:glycosyltransferase involved in cell wall biosynthesis